MLNILPEPKAKVGDNFSTGPPYGHFLYILAKANLNYLCSVTIQRQLWNYFGPIFICKCFNYAINLWTCPKFYPWLLPVCSTSILKTLWKKEQLLVMSNFSFYHSVFFLFGELSAIFN